MNVSSRVVAGVTILYLDGRLIASSGPTAPLCAIVRELIEDGRLVVLLHMAGVTDMDAHGIGVLVSSLTTLERCGGRMGLIAPSAYVRRLLAITKLDTVFKVYDSETRAIVSSRPITITTASRNRPPWTDSVAVLDGSL